MLDGIKLIRTDDKETEFLIEENIKVTLIAENFNVNGEMIVDYDEEALTESEVSDKVNAYFEKLISFLETNTVTKKIDELKEKIGEVK